MGRVQASVTYRKKLEIARARDETHESVMALSRRFRASPKTVVDAIHEGVMHWQELLDSLPVAKMPAWMAFADDVPRRWEHAVIIAARIDDPGGAVSYVLVQDGVDPRPVDARTLQGVLDALGSDGWEVVQVDRKDSGQYDIICKRRVPSRRVAMDGGAIANDGA